MAAQTADAPRRVGGDRSRGLSLILLGGLCGLAWAAGLRGFMTQITDDLSVTWSGTLGYILLPGLVIGLLLGWAEHLRRTGGRRHWRWLALSPLSRTGTQSTTSCRPGRVSIALSGGSRSRRVSHSGRNGLLEDAGDGYEPGGVRTWQPQLRAGPTP